MTLYERLLPQARELLNKARVNYPATVEGLIDKLSDEHYFHWTELPYNTVRILYDRIYKAEYTDPIEEEEVRMLFQDYWNEQ